MTKEQAVTIARKLSGASEGESGPIPGSFGALCTLYKANPRYKRLSPKTKKEYNRHIERLLAMWEKLPAKAITKAVIAGLQADMEKTPWEANAVLRTLRIVLGFGAKKEMLAKNAAADPDLYETKARTQIWDQPRIDAFLEAAGPEIRLACALLLYTVQRPSDVLAMPKARVVPRQDDAGRTRLWIGLRQAKTDELMLLPCHDRLEVEIREAPARASTMLVPSPSGRQWEYRAFARQWDAARSRANWRLARQALATRPLPGLDRPKARAKAKEAVKELLLVDLQRRDLRRTGMVMMAIAGATTAQIAAVSGHSIDQTQKILDTYIPRRPEVALGAIEAWEKGAKGRVIAIFPGRAKATKAG